MARDLFINGPTLVTVKGCPATGIATMQELGLSDNPIRMQFNTRHMDVHVDAYGGEVPFEIQSKLTDVIIDMTLMHVDYTILEVCLAESMGGLGAVGPGVLPVAGQRLGNNVGRFSTSWHFIELGLTSPVGLIPWRFSNCYLTGQPYEIPLGTERSIMKMQWRCIPYAVDPYAAGGVYGGGTLLYQMWDHIQQT
jgi:hypothetical protein